MASKTPPGPVVIASTPRSGSSWLSRLLRSHPGLSVYTHNTGDNYRLYLLSPLRALNPWSDDGAHSGRRRLDVNRVRLLRRLFPEGADGHVVVVQTPTLGPFLEHFVHAFPEARFVHLRRNPLDTIVSLREHMQGTTARTVGSQFRSARYRGTSFALRSSAAHLFHRLRWIRCPERGYLFARPSGFQGFLGQPLLSFLAHYYGAYESDIRTALQPLPESRAKTITYEDLVGSFERTFEDLLHFMGVHPGDVPQRKVSTVRPTSVGRHAAALNEPEITMIEELLASYEHLGQGVPPGSS